MKKTIVLHPMLLAAFPVLALYGSNIDEFTFSVTLMPLLLAVAGTFAVWLALRLVLRNAAKAGVITSVLVVIFFFYGHVNSAVASWRLTLLGRTWGPNAMMLPAMLLVLAVTVVLVIRTRRELLVLTKLLNVLAVALVVVSLVTIVPHELSRLTSSPIGEDGRAESKPAAATGQADYPNIYYIVLDGYARSDVAKALYGYDNTPFLAALRDKGFFVADKATANYWRTSLALPTTFNLDYLDAYQANVDKASTDRNAIAREVFRNSPATRVLKSRGYRIVVFHSGFDANLPDDADLLLATGWITGEFSLAVYHATAVPHITQLFGKATNARCRRQREIISHTLDHLPDTCEMEGPVFVMAHMIAPHLPFVFDADGKPIAIEGDDLPKSEYRKGYRDQLHYISGRILTVFDEILTRSKRPPVIILVSDHGPKLKFSYSAGPKNAPVGLIERFGVLSAYHLPGAAPGAVRDDISQVNNFRMVFDRYLGTTFGQLEDRNFISTYERLYDLTEVTDEVRRANEIFRQQAPATTGPSAE